METKQQNAHATSDLHRIEKLYIENTLLRISGALFCHDRKRASSRTEEIKLHSSTTEKTIVIRPIRSSDNRGSSPTRFSSR